MRPAPSKPHVTVPSDEVLRGFVRILVPERLGTEHCVRLAGARLYAKSTSTPVVLCQQPMHRHEYNGNTGRTWP